MTVMVVKMMNEITVRKTIGSKNKVFIWSLYIITFILFINIVLKIETNLLLNTLLFGLFLIIGDIFSVTLPQHSTVSVSSALIIAGVLLKFPIANIFLFVAIGTIIAILLDVEKNHLIDSILINFSKTIFAVIISFWTLELINYRAEFSLSLENIFKILIIVASYYLTDITIEQVYYSINQNVSFLQSLIGSMQLLGLTYAALASSGLLIVLLYPSIRNWSFILFLIPLAVTRYSFSLYIDIRKTYHNTIRALSATLEAQDLRRRGHARRVAELSVAIGRELNLSGRRLENINFAALLHDIGKIGFDEDSQSIGVTPDFLTKLEMEKHAIVGGEILRQVEYLKDSAAIIEKYKTNCTGDEPLEGVEDYVIPLGSRILNLANYFDELTMTENFNGRFTIKEAMEKIKKEQGYRFDPKTVRALYNIINRRFPISY